MSLAGGEPENSNLEKKIVLGWKIYEANVGFVRHFDVKPAPLIAIAAILSLVAGRKLEALKDAGTTVLTFGWTWLAIMEALLLAASLICIFASFLFIIASISPTAGASNVSLNPSIHGRSDRHRPSLIYFDDIAWHATEGKGPGAGVNSQPWLNHLNEADDSQILRDLADQVTENAVIASDKARSLRQASVCLLFGMWLIFVLVVAAPLLQLWAPDLHGLFK